MKINDKIKNKLISYIKSGVDKDLKYLFTLGPSYKPFVFFKCSEILDGNNDALYGFEMTYEIKGIDYHVVVVDDTFEYIKVLKTLIHECLHASCTFLDESGENIFKSQEVEELYVSHTSELIYSLLKETNKKYPLDTILKEDKS